jgi:hypothetical protein
MRRGLFAALLFISTVGSAEVRAHGLAGAFVSIETSDDQRADVLVKLPGIEDGTIDLELKFADDCVELTEPLRARRADGVLERWVVQCETALTGMEVEVLGLNAMVGEAFVELRSPTVPEWTAIVRRGTERVRLGEGNPRGLEENTGYFRLGIDHILSGLDQLLFVLALLLIVLRTRAPLGRRAVIDTMFATVTAFTVGHSITLAAATLDLLRLPLAPTEFVIALSVLLLAVELARGDDGTVTMRRPWVVAFAFGLLHGFGFAGVLAEIGLPASGIAMPLLLFNLGVELGQVLVVIGAGIAIAIVGLRRSRTITPFYRGSFLDRTLGYGVGILTAYWCFDRSLGWLL